MKTAKQNMEASKNAALAWKLATPAKRELVQSLASYVSEDDVGLSRDQMLRLVADRINEDLK